MHVPVLLNETLDLLITNPAGPVNFQSLQVPGFSQGKSQSPGGSDALDKVVAGHIRKVLAKTEGKIGGQDGAAELLQINPNTLRNRMSKLGIAYGRKR